MKKLLYGLFALALFSFISCENDTGDVVFNVTNNNGGEGTTNLQTVEIGGVQTTDLSLDGQANNEQYLLTSPLIMTEGTTLNIAAGTRIVSNAGTEGYIAIQQGAQIRALGNASNPIVMTSASASPSAGDWGGLVILGRAPINVGTTATSEVGNFSYGGTDPSDDSGILQYVTMNYTGAAINSNSEFNGISFYGVGSGTTVNFVEVNQGRDDGVEFFGGTVSGNNILLNQLQDDALDWTEGWTGTLTDVYIQTNSDSDKAIEADSNEDNNGAQPFSNPTLNNLTLIGIGSESGAEAIRLRRGTKVTVNNVFIQGFAEGIDIDNAQTATNAMNDEINFNQISFVDVPQRLVTDADSQMVLPSTIFTSVGMGTRTSVDFWSAGWTSFSEGANAPSVAIELSELDGNSDITLNAANSYTLSGALEMEAGTTLNIPAGTIIRADAGGAGVYIAIKQGAKIQAEGTATNPIVFTSNAANPSAGDWGGLLILGRARINAGTSATSEVANLPYGGNDDADNSGTLRYVRLEYTGAAINSNSEFNGFSFYGVGSGTVVEYIQAHEGADDGVEFFGGTVNASNVIVTAAQDDSVDWTEGYRGTLTDVYVQTSSDSDKVIEADGNEDNNTATPLSNPTLINFTAQGLGAGSGAEAFRIRRGTQVTFQNLVAIGFAEGFDIDNALTVDHIQNNASNVMDYTFTDVATALVSDNGSNGMPATAADFFSGMGNGMPTDVATWGANWSVGL